MNVTPVQAVIPPADIYILSSAHAVDALPEHSEASFMVIGSETQRALQEKGFTCEDVFPNASALKDHGLPEGKNIIHLGGRDLSPDTENLLGTYFIQSVCVYEANALENLPPSLEQALCEGRLHAVLCFSARAASIFTHLARCATNEKLWNDVHVLALSPRIVEALHGLPFASIRAAAQPNRNALLEMLSDEQYQPKT